MDNDFDMTKDEWQMFKHDKKLFKVYEENRFYCTCGHSVTIMPNEKRVLCNFCGHWVIRDPRERFRYLVKNAMYESRDK